MFHSDSKKPVNFTRSDIPELQEFLDHPEAVVEFFNPKYHHVLKTHERDELYFIDSGTAELIMGKNRIVCKSGDRLHVPANCPHYFDKITNDFASWAVLVP